MRLRGTRGHGGTLPHSLRQLLVQLSSVHGDIFEGEEQKKAYASFLLEGASAVLAAPLTKPGESWGLVLVVLVLLLLGVVVVVVMVVFVLLSLLVVVVVVVLLLLVVVVLVVFVLFFF